MFKTALFDCAINEKCCSVDGGRGICPLLSSPPWGIWQLKSPHPREFVMQGKKKKKRLGAAGIDWCIMLKAFDARGILSTPASDVYERLKTNGKAIKIARDY